MPYGIISHCQGWLGKVYHLFSAKPLPEPVLAYSIGCFSEIWLKISKIFFEEIQFENVIFIFKMSTISFVASMSRHDLCWIEWFDCLHAVLVFTLLCMGEWNESYDFSFSNMSIFQVAVQEICSILLEPILTPNGTIRPQWGTSDDFDYFPADPSFLKIEIFREIIAFTSTWFTVPWPLGISV